MSFNPTVRYKHGPAMIYSRLLSRSRRLRVILAAVVAAGLLAAGVLQAGPASAQERTAVSAAYSGPLYNGYSGQILGYGGLCLDVRADDVANLTPVQLYTCNGTGAQQWLVNGNGAAYQIELNPAYYPVLAGGVTSVLMCLDADRAGLSNGTPVQLYACNLTDPAQQWILTTSPANTLSRPGASVCLDDPAFATDGHTQLVLWSCNGGANQAWQAG